MVEKHSKLGTTEEKLNMQDVLSMRSSGYYSQRTAGKNAIDSVLPNERGQIIYLKQKFWVCGLWSGRRGEPVPNSGQISFEPA